MSQIYNYFVEHGKGQLLIVKANSCKPLIFSVARVCKFLFLIISYKKIDFSEISLAFLVTPCKKGECGRPHPDIIFKKCFDQYVPN